MPCRSAHCVDEIVRARNGAHHSAHDWRAFTVALWTTSAIARSRNGTHRTNRAHEVGDDSQRADAHAAEHGGGRNVALEDLLDGRLAVVAGDHHLRLLELLGDVVDRLPRHLDPRLGEERARRQDEHQVDDGVELRNRRPCMRVRVPVHRCAHSAKRQLSS